MRHLQIFCTSPHSTIRAWLSDESNGSVSGWECSTPGLLFGWWVVVQTHHVIVFYDCVIFLEILNSGYNGIWNQFGTSLNLIRIDKNFQLYYKYIYFDVIQLLYFIGGCIYDAIITGAKLRTVSKLMASFIELGEFQIAGRWSDRTKRDVMVHFCIFIESWINSLYTRMHMRKGWLCLCVMKCVTLCIVSEASV